MQLISVPDLNDSVMEAELDGQSFFLHLSWNSEAGFWTLGLQDATRTTLLEGLPVLGNTPLIGRYRTEAMPQGELIALPPDTALENGQERIGRSDLPGAGGASLVYVSAAEMGASLEGPD
ncbi:Hypothetical protein GbCGDNIH6_1568 [Granulibacter bethesdensis]|uniref:phage baseplate plug family protein n=1 Tax=Granulibacter bethesdensis TaxID=364410 RepID=UPI00090B5F1E|nr:hypothetical protein [Granulibacter bethesdensis]APH57390.1 Hypothetical protein GbCGDNIH6_1568 [Granulibacter bethesdensis]